MTFSCSNTSTYNHSIKLEGKALVYTLEWRHRRALGLVQGGGDNTAVGQVHLAMGGLLEGEGVLHPVLIISVGVILARVSATRLLAGGGSGGGLCTKSQSVKVTI